MVDIETGIPVPNRGRKPKYDFKGMEVGDSFFVEGDSKAQISILTCARRKHPQKFITRKATEGEKKGYRCWRAE